MWLLPDLAGARWGRRRGFDGELVELVPDERLVVRWEFVGPQRSDGPTFDSPLTITLVDGLDSSTVLALFHERLDVFWAATPEEADNAAAEWVMVMGKLEGMLGEETPAEEQSDGPGPPAPPIAPR